MRTLLGAAVGVLSLTAGLGLSLATQPAAEATSPAPGHALPTARPMATALPLSTADLGATVNSGLPRTRPGAVTGAPCRASQEGLLSGSDGVVLVCLAGDGGHTWRVVGG